MIEAIKIWNEPNNLSHWDFTMDPEWKEFSRMAILCSRAIRKIRPDLTIVLGGISPIDSSFIALLKNQEVLNHVDVIGVHGFPLDWNHWKIDEWPKKIDEIRAVAELPVWVTEVGTSTFGADEVQVFGLKRTNQLLLEIVERVYWYSLLDLPAAWGATTRHKESEGSSYYRHFYMGLIDAAGRPKPAIRHFNPKMGICQWFHFEDPRLEFAVEWLKRMGVKRLRTGISWADWIRPNALSWFDRQMEAIQDFETTITLCFTPNSRGKVPDHTSPPLHPEEFAWFAEEVILRYAPKINHLSYVEPTCSPQSNAIF